MNESLFISAERQQPLLSSRVGPVNDDERRKYEEERSKLYQQLDDKDDEIQMQSQLAERLQQQLMEQEDAIRQGRVECDNLMTEITRAQGISETKILYHLLFSEAIAKSKEETEELFSAIQEIALNLDQKKQECAQLADENEKISTEINKKNLDAMVLTSKVDEMKEFCTTQKVILSLKVELLATNSSLNN